VVLRYRVRAHLPCDWPRKPNRRRDLLHEEPGVYKLGSTWSVVIYHGRDPATGKEADGYLTALGIKQ
jgi:hypothetical protein